MKKIKDGKKKKKKKKNIGKKKEKKKKKKKATQATLKGRIWPACRLFLPAQGLPSRFFKCNDQKGF